MLINRLVPCLFIGRIGAIELGVHHRNTITTGRDKRVVLTACRKTATIRLDTATARPESKHAHVLVQADQPRLAEWCLILARLIEHGELGVGGVLRRSSLGLRGILRGL